MTSFIRFFASVKVAIVLIIILTIASILGTLIPQGRSPEEYLLRYGQLAHLFEKLQLTKLYGSFWYLALLFLFALNLIICTLLRLKPKIKRVFRPQLDFRASDFIALRNSQKITLNAPLETVYPNLRSLIPSLHYRIKEKKSETGLAFVGRKRIAGLFGSDVVHLAILLILIGGLTSGLFSFRTDLALHEGETTAIPRANFAVRLDAFITEYYPNGQVKDWKSSLTVIEGNREVLTKTVEVNHPLNYKKYMFYQSAYGWDWDQAELEIVMRSHEAQGQDKIIKVKAGEKITIDPNLEIQVHRFLPDFVLDENKRPFSRSNEPNNPAVLVEVTQQGEKIFNGWLFARFPDFGQMHPDKGSPLSLELRNYSASQYSVLHVSRDPGTSFVWAGCILIMLGLALAFYWTPREIRFLLQSEAGRTTILIGGIASKNKEALEKEIDQIISFLRKKK